MLTDCAQKRVQLGDVVVVALSSAPLGSQVGQIAFEDDPIDVGEALDLDSLAKGGEADQRTQASPDGLDVHPGGEAPPQPPLDQMAQPRL